MINMNTSKWVRGLCLLLLLPISLTGWTQSLVSNYGVPSTPVQVANGAATFKIRINGGTAACAGPRNLDITLPAGYVYVSGSAAIAAGSGSVAESSVLDNTATLAVSGIPASPDSTIISYQAYAGCGVIGGSSTTISYSLNGCAGTANATASVNAQNAQVNIISVTNSAYVGAVGDTYSRVSTLRNDGYGGIDTVYFQVTNGSSLSTASVTASDGALTDMGGGVYRIVGAGGGTLNNGESFTITETVSILSCSGDMTSSLKAYIAASGAECTAVSSTYGAGAAVGGSGTPAITFSVPEVPDLKCLPTDATTGWVTFQAKNTGAIDALVNLYTYASNAASWVGATAVHGNYPDNCASRMSYIDTAAGVTYSMDGGATWLSCPYSVRSWWNNGGYASDGKPLGLTFDSLTSLTAGDSVRFRFKLYDAVPSCCVGDYQSANYAITGNATDICGNNDVFFTWGAGISAINMAMSRYGFLTNSTVPDATDGDALTLSYSGFILHPGLATGRGDASAYVDFEFTLPAELIPSLSLTDMTLTKGATVINPASYTWDATTRKLRLHYLRSSISSYDYDQWTVSAKTTVSCLGTGVSSAVATLDIYSKYSSCWTSEWQAECNASISVALHGCNPGCSDGPNNLATIARRTNYGIYSATNNGIPGGTLDTANLNLTTTLYGDTLAVTNISKIQGSLSFSEMFVTFTKDEPDTTGFIDANAYVYNSAGTLVNTITGITAGAASVSADTSMRTIRLGSGSGAPATYVPGDSIVVVARFHQRINQDRIIKYTTDADASNSTTFGDASQVGCSTPWSAKIENVKTQVIGSYGWGNFNDCTSQPLLLATKYQLRPSAPQEMKHGIFPYEIRETFHLDSLGIVVATTTFDITKVAITVTGQGAATKTIDSLSLLSYDAATGTYWYDISHLADSVVGPGIPFSEGFGVFINPTFRVLCQQGEPFAFAVNEKTYIHIIPNDEYFTNSNFRNLFNGVSSSYQPPVASSATPNITAQNDTFSWEVQVTNSSAAAKPNVFLAEANEVNGVQIISVEALSGPGGTVTGAATQVGGVYQLDILGASASKYYKVTAYTTKCDNDTTRLLVGYNCYDYPADNIAAAAACKVDTLPLTVALQKPSLQLSVVTQPVGTVDLCDLLTYEVEVTNSGLGEATMLSVRTRLPATGGIEYVPGSFGIKYPSTAGSYTSLPDASVVTAGSNMIFNIPAATLASLPGTEKYRIRFQLKTTPCDFTSGEKVTFQPAGRNGCNTNILGTAVASNRINLNGVPPSVPSYTITSSVDSIIACGTGAATVNYRFRIVNTGSVTTTAVDGYRITLPSPYTMNTGVSFSHNPSTSAYSESPAAGVYDFVTGSGLVVGDSIVFTTTLSAPDMTALSCGASDPIVESGWVQFTATCSDPMITCNTKQLLEPENNTTSIVVQRPAYSLASLDVDEAASAAGSNIIGTVDLVHDNTVYEPQDVTLSLYEDANTNGLYDAGEVLLGNQTFAVADLATQSLSFNIATSISASTVLSSVVAVAMFECACDTPSASVQNVPLPVRFYDEQAKVNECSVQLSWSYESSGTMVAGFAIERQEKGSGWETIATVKESEHSYSDITAGAGQLLYRIKALTAGNESAYSRSLSATTGCKTVKVQVFPNPASNRFHISIRGAVSGSSTGTYTVTDKLGRVMLQGTVVDGSTSVDASLLSSGVYQVHVVYGGTSYTEQLTISE